MSSIEETIDVSILTVPDQTGEANYWVVVLSRPHPEAANSTFFHIASIAPYTYVFEGIDRGRPLSDIEGLGVLAPFRVGTIPGSQSEKAIDAIHAAIAPQTQKENSFWIVRFVRELLKVGLMGEKMKHKDAVDDLVNGFKNMGLKPEEGVADELASVLESMVLEKG